MAGRVTEFAEGVFHDLVQVAYGYIASVALLLRSPTRGPLRLAMRRRRSHTVQTAPHVTIFLSFILFFFIASRSANEQRVAVKDFLGRDSVVPEVRALLIGAFVSTVLVDASCRAILVVSARSRARRRAHMLTRLLYAIALQLAALTLIWSLILLAARNVDAVRDVLRPAWREYLLIAPLIAVVAAVTARFLNLTHLNRRRTLLIVRRVGLTVVVGLSIAGGLRLSDWIGNMAHASVVAKIKCDIHSDGSIDAFVLLRNDRRYPVSFDTDDMAIWLEPSYPDVRTWGPLAVYAEIKNTSAGAGQPYFILNPGDTGWVYARSGPSSHVLEAIPLFADGLLADCQFSEGGFYPSLGKAEISYMETPSP